MSFSFNGKMETRKPSFLDNRSTFIKLGDLAPDFVNILYERGNRTLEEKMRIVENRVLCALRDAKYSSHEIKESIVKNYNRFEEFKDLHPADVHFLNFNKNENSIVYHMGDYVQKEYLDLIVGWI